MYAFSLDTNSIGNIIALDNDYRNKIGQLGFVKKSVIVIRDFISKITRR